MLHLLEIMSTASDKSVAKKVKETEQVTEYMNQLEHPLKEEINAVRAIIKNANANISERIKWNAPSYYSTVDLLTFHVRPLHKVHLIFHHEAIVKIPSPLLEGDYKDRRMMYFNNMADIEGNKEELERILNAYVDLAGA